MLLVILLVTFFYLENNFIVTERLTMRSDKIQAPLTILHLSDLHAKKIESVISKFSRNLRRNKPDLILITGDLVSDGREKSLKYVDYLHDCFLGTPTYYVSGNHEAANYSFLGEFNQRMKEAGFTNLDNQKKEIALKGSKLYLAGLKDPGFYEENNDELQKARIRKLEDTGEKVYRILLAHRAEYTPLYNSSNFDLILTGHAHGGIIGVPFSKGGLYSTGEGFFPKYTKGLHGRTYISRGLGGSRFITRLFNHPQMSYLTLNS